MQLLYESATGLALFSSTFFEEIGKNTESVQAGIDDISKFGKMVKLVSFIPFKDAAHALEVANDVSEGKLPLSVDFARQGKRRGRLCGREQIGRASCRERVS